MTTQSNDFEALLQDAYADRVLNNAEVQQLRDGADVCFDELRNQFPEATQLIEFQQTVDGLVQCMQKGILSLKKGTLSADGKDQVIRAYGAQFAYMKANLDRFTQAL